MYNGGIQTSFYFFFQFVCRKLNMLNVPVYECASPSRFPGCTMRILFIFFTISLGLPTAPGDGHTKFFFLKTQLMDTPHQHANTASVLVINVSCARIMCHHLGGGGKASAAAPPTSTRQRRRLGAQQSTTIRRLWGIPS